MCLYLGGAVGQSAGQYMKVTSGSSGCHGTSRLLRVEGSLRGTFELELEARVQFLWQERKHEHCRWKGTLCPCAFSEEGFGYDQVLV